jgi:hypothetical protein
MDIPSSLGPEDEEALNIRVTPTVNTLHVTVVLSIVVGAAVRLCDLSNVAFNGLLGVVEDAFNDGRCRVRLTTGVISVKEGNLQLERTATAASRTYLIGLRLVGGDDVDAELLPLRFVTGRGEHTFAYLVPGRAGTVVVCSTNLPDAPIASITTATLRVPAAASPRLKQMLRQVDPEELVHFLTPSHQLGPWVFDLEGDWFWVLDHSYEFWVRLYQHALFTLPEAGSPMVGVINPENRYCIDLTRNVRWDKSKKLRRKKGEFSMSINRDFARSIELARKYHLEFHGSTWMTDTLIATLVRMTDDAACAVKSAAFELWDVPDLGEAPRLCAVVLGFGCGSAWHDVRA